MCGKDISISLITATLRQPIAPATTLLICLSASSWLAAFLTPASWGLNSTAAAALMRSPALAGLAERLALRATSRTGRDAKSPELDSDVCMFICIILSNLYAVLLAISSLQRNKFLLCSHQ